MSRKDMVIESIPVRLIIPSRFRLREIGDVEGLAQSIRENGIVIPLEVIPLGDNYNWSTVTVASKPRSWRASSMFPASSDWRMRRNAWSGASWRTSTGRT